MKIKLLTTKELERAAARALKSYNGLLEVRDDLAEFGALVREIEYLRSAFRIYADHADGCPCLTNRQRKKWECACGFFKIQAALVPGSPLSEWERQEKELEAVAHERKAEFKKST